MTCSVDGNLLDGVSATALWTLHFRANEAKRSDGVIRDPWAVALFDAIDYDYLKFGRPNPSHALRAVAFDAAARDYLTTHPKASVVALAEGLQTSFWRLDRTGLIDETTWYSIDLPQVIALREKLLPSDERIVALAQSALDRSWMDRVDAEHGVVITAEGLLMYLQPEEALGLIAECAKRFPGAQMMFDLPPAWFAAATTRGVLRPSLRYRVPPMPFSLTPSQVANLVHEIPGIRAVHDVPIPPGRGKVFNTLLWTAQRLPVFDAVRPVFVLLEFG